MRLSKLLLVSSVLFCSSTFALVIVKLSHRDTVQAVTEHVTKERDPIHPITLAMRTEAGLETAVKAPTLKRTDTEGANLDLAKLSSKGPVLLLFIMEGCPCSIEAQPFFQRMYDSFGAKVPFVGITDGNLQQGKEWKAHFQMTFPLISDPSKDLMKSFGAKHSAYTALVGRGGRIVRLWPGYNQDMLVEIRDAIAAEASLPTPNLVVEDAPTKPTSGCAF